MKELVNRPTAPTGPDTSHGKKGPKKSGAGNNRAGGSLSKGTASKRPAGASTANESVRAEMVKILPRLQRFAYALSGSLDTGNDLAQEACARALTRIEQWQPGTRLDSWMFRITHNIWLDRGRASKVRGEVVDITAMHNLTGVDGRDVMDTRQTLALVMEGIEKLPEDQKVLIALVCIDGLSYKETAKIVDVPIGTVMSRLARARKSLHILVNREAAAGTAVKRKN